MGHQDAKTERFDDLRWLPPVDTAAQLPKDDDIRPGAACFVTSEAAVYDYFDGRWTKQAEARPSGT